MDKALVCSQEDHRTGKVLAYSQEARHMGRAPSQTDQEDHGMARMLNHMGRVSACHRVDPHTGRAHPHMGRVHPHMGRVLAWDRSREDHYMAKADPHMARADPHMGRAVPHMGRAVPHMGQEDRCTDKEDPHMVRDRACSKARMVHSQGATP